jgi:hypothetical protein
MKVGCKHSEDRPETRFLGVSQAKCASLGRRLIGQSGSFGEKTWFLCPVLNGEFGSSPNAAPFLSAALLPAGTVDRSHC